MMIDSHVHIFSSKIISNVSQKKEMVSKLGLQTDSADQRTTIKDLEREIRNSSVDMCFMLPTAGALEVQKINEIFMKTASEADFLYTAGTLHPEHQDNETELEKLNAHNIRGIKLCSFSQGFVLNSDKAYQLFQLIQEKNINTNRPFCVVLDTFYMADIYFGTNPEYNTTPKILGDLVNHFPRINFIAAHMGGLTAPFNDICRYLLPLDNLFLDTSNAAHTLSENEFIHLLKTHGPEHILFGTDWPWFGHTSEIELIDSLLEKAGYSQTDKKSVFGKNVAGLLGI